jgi:photosystem II stability/assembly factor-like uncharacterized protein
MCKKSPLFLRVITAMLLSVNSLHAQEAFAVMGSRILAGAAGGLLESDDDGMTWRSLDIGIGTFWAECLLVENGNIFVGTNGNGIFRSTNHGETWSQVLSHVGVRCLVAQDTLLFAGTYGGLLRSGDSGEHWGVANNGLGDSIFGLPPTIEVRSLCSPRSGIVLAGAGGWGNGFSGVFRSSDNGNLWTPTDLKDPWICAMFVSDSAIFAGSDTIFISTNQGQNWKFSGSSLPLCNITSFAHDSMYLFAGTSSGVFRSTDGGRTWISCSSGLDANFPGVSALSASATSILAGTGDRIYRSTDHGLSWRQVQTSLAVRNPPSRECLPRLMQNYPNPFNPITTITFFVPIATYVDLSIYNVIGQKIHQIIEGFCAAGYYEVPFNGSDQPSGVYIYRLRARTMTLARAMLLIK